MKILIVKLGALGDVLRTTPLLSALKRKHPKSSITWFVDSRHRDVLEKNPLIDSLKSYSESEVKGLEKEFFDLAINLDKDEEALDSIMAAQASVKKGFGRDKDGKLCALDAMSDYAYRLGIDDELKFKLNQKTYQEISFEQAGFSFNKEEYIFSVPAESDAAAGKALKAAGFEEASASRPVIGINTGSGVRFAGKKLPETTLIDLAKKFKERLNATIFLLGGQDEIERNQRIAQRVGGNIINTGSHPIMVFASIVKRCDLIVSGDTTAMHIAVAMKVPVVTYFGSTCASEIELYGRGAKLVSTLSCAPCYKKVCPIDDECMKQTTPESLFQLSERLLKGVHV